MAAIQLARGHPDKALPMFEKAAAIRHDVGDRRGEAATLHNIANCHHRLGNYADSAEAYRKVVELRGQIGDQPVGGALAVVLVGRVGGD